MAEILSTLSSDGLKGTPTNGGARYVLMSTWENAQQQDLVSGGNTAVLECYGDDYGGLDGALIDGVQIASWVSNQTNNLIIRPAVGSEHNGVQRKNGGTGFAMSGGTPYVIENGTIGVDGYAVISGLELLVTGSGSAVITQNGVAAAEKVIYGEMLFDAVNSTMSNGDKTLNIIHGAYEVRNSLIKTKATGLDLRGTGNGATLQNLTVDCTGIGQYGILNDGTTVSTNCVCINNSTKSWLGTSGTNSNNASEDGNAPGANSVTGISDADGVDFTSPSTGDYTPVLLGKLDGAVNPGADLSGTFTTDITGATRSVPWEIGAWEIQGAAAETADTNTFTITIASGITPPTGVDAGGPYTGDVDTAIQLAGTFTPGSDPTPVLTWTIEAGSAGSGTFTPNANAEDPTFTPDTVGNYNLKFSVNPSDGSPVEDTATLDSQAVAPTGVDAGGPYSGLVSTPIQLAGTFTPGSDPTPVLTWSINSGGTGTFLPNANAEDPTFTPDSVALYTLRFSVNPSDGAAVEDTATLDSQAAPTAPSNATVDGPWVGQKDTAIPISATITEGTGANYSQLWTSTASGGADGVFGDATALSTTFTPDKISDSYVLTFTGTNDEGSSADSASLDSVNQPPPQYTGTGDADFDGPFEAAGVGVFAAQKFHTGTGNAPFTGIFSAQGAGVYTQNTVGTGDAEFTGPFGAAGAGVFTAIPGIGGTGNADLTGIFSAQGGGVFTAQFTTTGTGDADLDGPFSASGVGSFAPAGQPTTSIYFGDTELTNVVMGDGVSGGVGGGIQVMQVVKGDGVGSGTVVWTASGSTEVFDYFVVASSPQFYYKADESTSPLVDTMSGPSLSLVDGTGMTYGNTAPFAFTGGCVQGNSGAGNIRGTFIGTPTPTYTADFSMLFITQPNNTTGADQAAVGVANTDTNTGYLFGLKSNSMEVKSGSVERTSSLSVPDDGSSCFCLVVHDSDVETRFYLGINSGTLAQDAEFQLPATSFSGAAISVAGANDNGATSREFLSTLGRTAYWNRALTPAEVQQLWDAVPKV